MTLALHYAARSHVGLLREGNEDSGYAGPQLLAVADGMGGHAAGEVASAIAIATVAHLDDDSAGSDPLARLAAAVRAANAHLRDMVAGDPELGGMGTTLTAMLKDGARFGLVHIGDSRGYLLRDGTLQQITRDHTFVQTLIDEGRISVAEADHHPQRSLILRALDGRDEVEPDLSIREARVGDRYLICSDGLSGVVSQETIRDTLASATTPDQAVDQLVELALRGGGPDNITAIVADVVDAGAASAAPALTVGAAAEGPARRREEDTPAARAAALGGVDGDDGDIDDDVPGRGRRAWWVPLLLLLLLLLVGAGFAAWTWSQRQYYVGTDSQRVAIFRGLPEDIGPVRTSRLHQREDIALRDLPVYQRDRVRGEIPATGLADAQRIVRTLREQAELCRRSATQPMSPPPTATATAAPEASPGASSEHTATASPGASADASGDAQARPAPRGCGDQS